ncbi:P-loop NTPase fold protein [Halanaerobacter jeridensis]|uniref:KAP NTPase domain-containing protein n=1 Tax=Halanaerobacter jeridensis TaxID=706427 RepID=A0A939BQC0_9FIRM|nr:P-loop NTPase fold protein [Halanaerobacter jeridensis]MBM7558127.1 hypothetical protein [Halanaerobacter jeridensis]
MENKKIFINVIIISILLSSIFFFNFEINIMQYTFFMGAFLILLFWNYNMPENLKIFDLFIIVSLGNFLSYIFINKIIYSEVEAENIFLISGSLLLSVLSIRSYLIYKFSEEDLNKNEKLFYKRQKDLKRLSSYLKMFDIIGVNAMWGAGKTFLVNKLKKRIKEDYEIIEIDILSCNFDEFQITLINEIEKVMDRNKIISMYSNKLKQLLANEGIISKVKNLIFVNNYSFSQTIKEFQAELNKIDKKIVIIYEDIDRISDKNMIKKIFSLSEKLSNENIKIIYQYHEQKLKEKGFSNAYLEKYIQFKMNLTNINFFEIVQLVFRENNFDEDVLMIDDFEFLKDYVQKNRNNTLQRVFGINKVVHFTITNVSIRRVKNFLDELYNIIDQEGYKDYKETVISFFFLKHFISTEYEKLNIEEGLLETFKFEVDSELYTITELIDLYNSNEFDEDSIEEIFNDEQNARKYSILKLFNYNYQIGNQIKTENNEEKRLKLIKEEGVDLLKARNSNEKKDRLIWNLLANGKSKYTDYEYVGNKFVKDVLNQSEEKQEKAYREFKDDLFHTDSIKDNKTIFKLKVPSFIELFKSFRVANVSFDDQINLIKFYFKAKGIEVISKEVLQTINYCNLKTNKEYIYVLNRINKLDIEGNLNSEDCFAKFLKKFIGALSRRGYINTMDYFMINNEKINEGYKNKVIDELKMIIKRINTLKSNTIDNLEFEELKSNLNVIVEFLNKMIDLINCKDQFKEEREDGVETRMESRYINQEEFDRLKKIKSKDEDEFKKKLRKSYINEKITPYEIKELLDCE